MNHKLNLKAAEAYGRMHACVPDYSRINFVNAFNEFLDAYDGNSKPDKTQTVQNFQREVGEQRTIPKVGEVYRSRLQDKIKIVAVIKDRDGCVIAIQALKTSVKPLVNAVEFLPLSDFEQMGFTKED